MGRYSDAGEVKVNDKNPLINDEEGTHLCEIVGVREGDSGSTGLPFVATELKILQSETLREGAVYCLLCSQKASKGARNYYVADVKQIVGGAQGTEDKNEVSGEDIDAFCLEGKGVGAVMAVRVYKKAPNKHGKVFCGFQCTHVSDEA